MLWHSKIVHQWARVTVLSLVFIFWSDLTWMAFKSKYHMACVTSRDTLVITIHYAGVRHHWDASHYNASFGRLKIWRLRERLHYTVVILNNLLSLAHGPVLIHNSYDLQLARTLSLLWQCERGLTLLIYVNIRWVHTCVCVHLQTVTLPIFVPVHSITC